MQGEHGAQAVDRIGIWILEHLGEQAGRFGFGSGYAFVRALIPRGQGALLQDASGMVYVPVIFMAQ